VTLNNHLGITQPNQSLPASTPVTMTEEKKTVLRSLFEESFQAPSTKFVLFDHQVDSSQNEENLENEQQPIQELRPMKDVFLEAEAEIRLRWPEPVGSKFLRSTDSKEKWLESKEELKIQSKRKYKDAVKRGITRPVKKTKA
jgi:hypothetical protein